MQAASQGRKLSGVFSLKRVDASIQGEAGQQVNINIMEYSERNVRQLTLNEQEDTSRKINAGVINTPTLIRSDY